MLKKALLAQTALAGALVCLPMVARSADVTVASGSTSGAVALSNASPTAQNLSVQAGGTVTASGSTATVTQSGTTGTPSTTINNAGTISNTGTGRAVDINDNTAARTLSIINDTTGTISSVAGDTVRVGKNLNASSSVAITNSGTIQSGGSGYVGLGQAIDLRSVTNAFTSTITNNATGVIEALTDDAVRPGTNTTIENNGIIRSYGANTSGGSNGTADGIDAGGILGVTVNNNATGTISGARHGITADTNITVTNRGEIVGRNGSGVGSDGNGTVVNYGTITGAYAGTGNIFNSDGTASTNGDGDGVDIDGTANITNYGTIQGTGAGGVDSGGQANHSEGIAAGGGTIDNKSGALIHGAYAGILIDNGSGGSGTAATTITNAGTIQGAASYAIKMVGNFNDTVTNSGTIKAGGGGLAIDMGAGNDKVYLNGGSVSGGNIEGGDGTDQIYFFNSGSGTFVFDDGILNFEQATVSGGKVVLRGTFQATTAVTIASGAQFQVDQAFSTGTLTNNGTLSAAENNAIRTVSVTGSYSQGASGVLEVRINSASSYDKIAVTGTATLADGATIRPLNTSYVASGSTFNLLTSSGLTANAGALTIDASASPLLSWNLSNDGNNLVATATRTQTFATVSSGSGAAAGSVLEAIGSSATGDMQTVITSLQNQSSASAVGTATKQLAPTPSGGALQGGQAAALGTSNTVQTRMAAIRNGQNGQVVAQSLDNAASFTDMGRVADSTQDRYDAQGPMLGVSTVPAAARTGIWGQGFGASADQKAHDVSEGYKSRTAGFAIGADTPLDDDTVVGFAGSFARTFVDGRGTQDADRSTIDSYQFTAYGTQSFGNAFIEASLSGGMNHYDSRRTIAYLDRIASADYSGWQGLAKVTGGHNFPVGDDMTVTPLVSLQYAHAHLDNYSETGAGAASLNVDSQDYDTLTPALGVRLQTAPITVVNGVLTPVASAAVSYDVVSDKQSVTSAFTGGGSSFVSEGASPSRTAFNSGLGMTYREGDIQVEAGYQLELRERYMGHAAMLRLRHDL